MTTQESRRIIFNAPNTAEAVYIRSNEPVVQLVEQESFLRVQRQCDKLVGKKLADADPIFGGSLNWAYHKYTVQRLSPPNGQTDPDVMLGTLPAQPLVVKNGKLAGAEGASTKGTLCLFNVLVAMEWQPNQEEMQQLMWAFRRASDFLYDVTDGRMAFGQVVFGGSTLIDCADIQIMASNHIHPRTWVNGLHENHKYLPIRMGRGHWPSRNGVCIPWDEPEGYRVIVHEWGHYALGLRDEYITQPIELVQAHTAGFTGMASQVLVKREQEQSSAYTIVSTLAATSSESIMASLEGTSELVPQSDGNQRARKQAEWRTINQRYPWLKPPKRTLQGPGRLPLPLPCFQFLDDLDGQVRPDEELVLTPDDLPSDVTATDFTVYTARPDLEHPTHVIAQGGFEARFGDDGLALLGAQQGDAIILVSPQNNDALTVHQGRITGSRKNNGLHCATINWTAVFAEPLPIIDVVADTDVPYLDSAESAVAHIRVRLRTDAHVSALPDTIAAHLFLPGNAGMLLEKDPAKSDARTWVSKMYPVPALDGHILVHWDTQFMVSTFSHGGNPPSSSPRAPVPPITAGSADGNVLLFFHDDTGGRMVNEKAEEYSKVKVITTMNNGAQGVSPHNGARALGAAFSLTSNYALPREFFPSLLVRYAMPSERELLTGDLLLCRLENGVWQPQPTYTPVGTSLAAMPLTGGTATNLIADPITEPRIEHYRLYWVPR